MRAYHETYRLPVLLTNCSNNYGPFQFPEKLIPLMILNALEGTARDRPLVPREQALVRGLQSGKYRRERHGLTR